MATKHPLTALQLFRFGHDTLAIANILNTTEAMALEQLSRERSAVLGRPDPYNHPIEPPLVPWPSGRVAYAGRQ